MRHGTGPKPRSTLQSLGQTRLVRGSQKKKILCMLRSIWERHDEQGCVSPSVCTYRVHHVRRFSCVWGRNQGFVRSWTVLAFKFTSIEDRLAHCGCIFRFSCWMLQSLNRYLRNGKVRSPKLLRVVELLKIAYPFKYSYHAPHTVANFVSGIGRNQWPQRWVFARVRGCFKRMCFYHCGDRHEFEQELV